MAVIQFLKQGMYAVVFLVLIANALAGIEYQEGIHLVRPESRFITTEYAIPQYLTVEDIAFISCAEEDVPIRNSLLCLDDNSFEDLEVMKWSQSDNCYVSSFNLDDFECQRLMVQAEYTKAGENIRMTEVVRVNKLSKVLDKIIDSQYSDGGWKDPLSTAYGIWALSYFSDIYEYELDIGIDWLKLARNEEKKCWPKAPCNVEMSSNILALLTLSNFTESRRVVNDARNWFEELQNDYSQGDDWYVIIRAVTGNSTLSLVSYDEEVLDTNFTLPLNDVKNYSFKAYFKKRLLVISDDNVEINVTNDDGELLISYQGDNLSYIIPGACWSVNMKGEPCDDTASMYALITPVDDDQKDLAKSWATSTLKNGAVLGKYFGAVDSPLDTALYLYNLYDDDKGETHIKKVVDWLLYTQNNEGSWTSGTTETEVIPSAYSVMSLIEAGYNRSSEPIDDAEEWVSAHEDNITLNNTRALSSAFFILRHNARPLLASQPKILSLEQYETQLELYNPTTFDLTEITYELTDDLKDYVSVEQKEEIDAYSYRKLAVWRNDQPPSDAYGFLVIKNLGVEIAKIPMLITDSPSINITAPSSLTVFGRNGELLLKVQKSSHEFICTMNWESAEISTSGSVKVKGNTNLPLDFTQALTKDDVYTGTLTCKALGKTVQVPLSVYIQRYAATPITIEPEDIVVNSTLRDVSLKLKNNLDRDVSVKISLDRYANYFSFRNTLTLDPNEEVNFTLTNLLPPDLNLTSNVLIEFDVLNKTEIVTMLIDVETLPAQDSGLLLVLVKIFIVLAALGGIGFVIWKFRDVLFAELNKLTFWKIKTEKKKETIKIMQLKKDEEYQAVINIYNIMKLQNKDDKDIASKLLRSFSKETITEALNKVGTALPILDEEAPEKIDSA